VRVSVLVPGYLLVEQVVDSGIPAAQAVVDSIDSTAYAGYPYPGSDTLGAYGLVATTGHGQTGQSVPDYPLAAISSSDQPHDHKQAGPVSLDAQSTDSTSAADAKGLLVGDPVDIGSLRAKADVDHAASGVVTAVSSNEAEAVEIAGLLRLGAVSSSASVTASPDGTRKRTADLHVGDVSILGQAVGLTDKGLTVAGTTTPIPTDSPLTQALRQARIDVQYVSAQQTPDGVISAGLRVTTVQSVPGLPEPVTVQYLFGRSAAFATAGAGDAAAGSATTTAGGSGAAAGSAPQAPAAIPGLPDASAPGPAPGAGSAPQLAGSGARPAASVEGSEPLMVDPALFYLVLALAGVTLVGGVQLLRLFGVRVLWNG
jgi:hypothetical protein